MHNFSPCEARIVKGDEISKSHNPKSETDKESMKQNPSASAFGSLV